MSNHTPGPWKVFDGHGSNRFAPAIVDGIPDIDGKCVANCICHVATTNDDVAANARLIAAAPELLAALESLVDSVQRVDPGVYGDDVASARKAIRKARGDSA